MTACTLEQWAIAQEGEYLFWQTADRTRLCRTLDALYVNALQIDEATVAGCSILDLGGGPMPLAALLDLPFASLTVVDPLPNVSRCIRPRPNVQRMRMPAEDYTGPLSDEVWGYNVLQHVIDPAMVLETAKRHARFRVRWFDWVDTPLADHHPHSLTAAEILAQFAGWPITHEERGSFLTDTGVEQQFLALVAERPPT